MCLIAYAPNKSLISLESLANAYENNKDGWGIVYQDTEANELVINKQLLNFEEFKKAWETVPENVHVGVHFRWRTHGELNRDNVHPYMILDKSKGDPVDLALMHNGVISYIHKSGDARSDTQMYVDLVLRPILLENWKLVYNPSFQFIIERDISSGSKFLLLPSEGAPIIYNKSAGHEDKDQPNVWYSNSYSIKTSTWRATKNAPVTPSVSQGYTYDRHKSYSSEAPWFAKDTYKYENQHTTMLFPNDLTADEFKHRDEIMLLVPKDHCLLERVARNGKTILGYGWTQEKYGTTKALVFSQKLAAELKKFYKKYNARKEASKEVPSNTNVVALPPPTVMDKDTLDRLTSANLSLFSRQETMDWVITNPELATEYLIKAGFSGGSTAVLSWINKNIDQATEQVYNYAHFRTLVDTQATLPFSDISEDDYMYGAYGYA